MIVLKPARSKIVFTSLLLVALCIHTERAHAQDTEAAPADTVLVVLVDGSEITGVVLESSEDEIVLRTLLRAVMTIPRVSIVSIESISDRKFHRSDPNVTRLLSAPTARALGNGRGYFADFYLFFPFIAVGAGDHVNMAGGISLIPGLGGQFLYLAPKVTFTEKDKSSLAGGILINKYFGEGMDDVPSFGMAYGVGTFGSTERALTLGFGLGFIDGDFADSPAFLIAGEFQMSESAKLITENYLIFGENDLQILSSGIRIFGRKLAVDLAMITTPQLVDGEGFPFIPFVGFAYNFGRQ